MMVTASLSHSSLSLIVVIKQTDTQQHVGECETSCMLALCACVRPTVKREWLGEGQNSDVPAVVINVSIYKWQVAAVVNNRLDLHHVGVDRFIIDRAQQHTPTINKAVPSSRERHNKVSGELFSVVRGVKTYNFTHMHYHQTTDGADTINI